jgi:hypothetical protein
LWEEKRSSYLPGRRKDSLFFFERRKDSQILEPAVQILLLWLRERCPKETGGSVRVFFQAEVGEVVILARKAVKNGNWTLPYR